MNQKELYKLIYTNLPTGLSFDELEKYLPSESEDDNPVDSIIDALRKWNKIDWQKYLESNIDVNNAGVDPVRHYVENGIFEGRKITAKKKFILKNTQKLASGIFIKKFISSLPTGLDFEYLFDLCNKDLWIDDPESAALYSLLKSGSFDYKDYLERYPDVKIAGINPVRHFIYYGIYEDRVFKYSLKNRHLIYTDSISKILDEDVVNTHDENIIKGNEIDIPPVLFSTSKWGPGHEKLVKLTPRPDISDILIILEDYDVISLDIFDTALFRKVEFPRNIFDIMALEVDWSDFSSARIRAEQIAREEMKKNQGHREIVIDDIYAVLEKIYGVPPIWKNREIELEQQATVANPYILSLYERLKSRGKTLVFTSDMYLPEETLAEMLRKAGYDNYHKIYLSNIYKLCKGDGTLQKKLPEDFPGKKIVHIGDNRIADVEKTVASGIDSLWYPECRLPIREPYLNNICGSVYRATINNTLNNGLWNKNRYYTHGYRVGGILAAGFCQHINRLARQNKIDKILFCGRDCFIIQKVYESFYKQYENAYIETSRYCAMMLTPERYLSNILDRFIFRYWDENSDSITLQQLLEQTGFPYLVEFLETHDINKFDFCCSSQKSVFAKFFLSHTDIIRNHCSAGITAGIKYFSPIIGGAKEIMIVDVGWSGTCIDALGIFFKNRISSKINITGALVCSSNTMQVANDIIGNHIHPYISSPIHNSDFSNFLNPPGKKDVNEIDRLHMPLEYLFTADTPSLLAYRENGTNSIEFIRDTNLPPNIVEIHDMQQGIYDFNAKFSSYASILPQNHVIPPYTAFTPLKNAISDDDYCREIYSHFLYDAGTVAGRQHSYAKAFATFVPCGAVHAGKNNDKRLRKILFVSPELTYTGTPQSLLRTARVVRKLGYEPVILSAKDGPFRNEFSGEGIDVHIVPAEDLDTPDYIDMAKSFCLVWCNTIMTDSYVNFFTKYVPTIWFIREAENIPSFCGNKPARLELLNSYDKIYCVSEYAAKALGKYSVQKIKVLPNCVEDESNLAVDYIPGSGEKINFVQFGTMEYRKGYDVLVAAYKSLPVNYKNCCALYFAGGFINSGAPYCEYLFQEMRDEPDIHYLGIIKGAKNKVGILSQMDVIVVASRDESCSLVALEGAMLSRPLVVTENVGAKYMVGADNGIIVPTGDVEAMRNAMIRMIDMRKSLHKMGTKSRSLYEEKASMPIYVREIDKLLNREIYNGMPEVIVSLTSHPGRMNTICQCVESLLAQEYANRRIILWLAKEQFPALEKDLPGALVNLVHENYFEIRWVDDDLKPHKKYFHAMREFPDMPVVTVDDDVIYEPCMLGNLVDSYLRHPHAVSCHRANLMQIRKDGSFKPYDTWPMDYSFIKDRPSYRLMPTGVGGVLYPPHALPDIAFDKEAIKRTCLMADDLWLKMMTVKNGYPTVRAKNKSSHQLIEGSQDVALWKHNVINGENDILLNLIIGYIDNICKIDESISMKIWNGLYID